MQIRTIQQGFKSFESKFETIERNSKHSKIIRSILNQIRTIRKGFEAFECKFEQFETDTKHSKVIRSIRMQIRTIRKISEVVECKFNHSKGIWSVEMKFLTIWKGLEAFQSKC